MFTRRTATVIISAPDASCALTITAGDEYLPVPTMRREENDLPAIISGSIRFSHLRCRDRRSINRSSMFKSPHRRFQSPSTNEVHNLDLITIPDLGRLEGRAFK